MVYSLSSLFGERGLILTLFVLTSFFSNQFFNPNFLAMKNKLFILEAQMAEEEAEGLIPIRMNQPTHLLPGQQAVAPKVVTHSQARRERRPINSRAIGLSNAHLNQFESDNTEGGGVRFARRGFGGNRK